MQFFERIHHIFTTPRWELTISDELIGFGFVIGCLVGIGLLIAGMTFISDKIKNKKKRKKNVTK